MAKIINKEPSGRSQICGWQIAYGLPWSEFCGERKAPGLYFCKEHDQDARELYPHMRMAPGNVKGRTVK